MPDIFVAPDENKNEDLHKRTPVDLGENVKYQKAKVPPLTPSVELKKENPEIKAQSINSTANLPNLESYSNTTVPLLASYWLNPKGIYFETQEPNESIVLFLRKHFLTNSSWISTSITLILIPPVCFLLLFYFKVVITFIGWDFIKVFVLCYYIFILNYAFIKFLHWFYNVAIITRERIFDVDLTNLVSTNVAATKISQVQDVKNKQTGTLRSIFNFGDILIQTAGTQDNFLIHAVPKPETVVDIVESLIGRRKDDDNEISG